MKLTTSRICIRNIARNFRVWYATWLSKDAKTSWSGKPFRLIAEELDRLDKETATPEDVRKIIGAHDYSWTGVTCCECGKNYDKAVYFSFSAERDAQLCEECLRKALDLIQKGDE